MKKVLKELCEREETLELIVVIHIDNNHIALSKTYGRESKGNRN